MNGEATCHVCLDTVSVDGENAGIWAGKVICRDCLGTETEYVTECIDCGWDYTCEDRVANWYHAQVRVQQEGNSHEAHKSFDGEDHTTVWRRVE